MEVKIKMDNELYHHGILGMKWGVRRYQKRDGTLTNAGKKRYDDEMKKLNINEEDFEFAKKKFKTKRVNRLRLEQEYNNLSPRQISKGQAFVDRLAKSVITPAAEEIGRQVVKSFMTKKVNEFITDDDLKVFTNNKKK